ncbi:MAG TPA: hypothetical protein VGO93_17125 [Candidatus Xenobia bacterium]|jgi:hypothetical protein
MLDGEEQVRSVAPDLPFDTWGTLEDLMRWMHRSGLSLRSMERVAMDEYCHDVLVPLSDGRWLSVGCT